MDPTRLIDGEGDGFERELLGVARRDGPPSGAVARSAAVLGLAASVSISATTAGTASAAGAKATGATFGALSLAKWVGIGAAVGVVTTAGVRLASDPEIVAHLLKRDTPAVTVPAHQASKATIPVLEQPVPAIEPETAGTPAPAAAIPSAPAAALKPRPLVAPLAEPAPTEPAPPSLAAEVGALDRARRALLEHRPSGALRALDDYSAARRTSVLEAEAELLRAEALLQAGQRSAAAELAQRALEHAPNGPHAVRLREIARE